MTISLVVGYLNYTLGQVGNGHLLYVYFGSDWGTVVKIGLLGTMAAPKSGGMHFGTVSISTLRSSTIYTIIESSFHPTPQTRNGHTKKGIGSLIRLLGGTTAKWLQIGAALTFLSNKPSLLT